MANTYLTRTFVSGGSGTTWTFSAWVKRSTLGGEQPIFSRYQSSSYQTFFGFAGSNQLVFKQVNAGSTTGNLTTNRLFRDTTAWYHIVVVWDTTNSTAGNRMRLYINGVEETSFATDTNPSSGLASTWGNANPMEIARSQSAYFNGLMSHINFCDGTALAPTVFGETDATTGEWKIKTSPSFTLGTTGFTILKDGNTITDQSTNSNNWTLGGGTLTKTEDCPSDVFATMNPLESRSASGNTYPTGFHNGNTVTNFNDAGDGWTKGTIATLAPSAGKYYWELKVVLIGGDVRLGVVQGNYSGTTYGGNSTWNAYSYTEDGQKGQNGGGSASYGNSFTTGDYISFALDCGTGTIWCAKNGTWQNSATTSEISAGTTTNSMYTGINMDNGLAPHNVMYDGTPVNISLAYNFGNGSFVTTQLTGTTYSPTVGNTGAVFKYAVPTGYTALSTKGLNL